MRSRLFLKKTRRIERIPARSDEVVAAGPAEDPFALLTEDGQELLTETGDVLQTEH